MPPRIKTAAKTKLKRNRKTKRAGNLAEFFAASPLRGSGLVIERSKDEVRSAIGTTDDRNHHKTVR